jgi:deuterolysin
MKIFAGVSLLVSMAVAVSVDLSKRDSPLVNVKLEMIGNTEVKVSVTNFGGSPLKVLKVGTFLDSSPVEKVEVYAKGKVFHAGSVGQSNDKH